MSDFKGLFDVRVMTKSDENFIASTFLRSLYYGDSWFSLIPKDIFMSNYSKIVGKLLNSQETIVYVACLKEDPEVIIGYSILSTDALTIHWVYIKKAWRSKGVARALLPKFPNTVTHLTKVGKNLLSKFPNAIFNPFQPI